MQVTINLNKMQFYAYHGVLPQEREVGGVFEVSLKLSVSNVEKAVLFDRLEETINYAEVYELTKSVMRKPTLLGYFFTVPYGYTLTGHFTSFE